MTREEFISAATEMYGSNVAIRCSKHGMFYTTPYQLLHGLVGGCFECYKEKWWEDKEKGL